MVKRAKDHPMSAIEAQVDAIERVGQEAAKTPKTALAFLVMLGVYTKSGKLTNDTAAVLDRMDYGSPSLVLGFHGCDQRIGEQLLSAKIQLKPK